MSKASAINFKIANGQIQPDPVQINGKILNLYIFNFKLKL